MRISRLKCRPLLLFPFLRYVLVRHLYLHYALRITHYALRITHYALRITLASMTASDSAGNIKKKDMHVYKCMSFFAFN